MQRFTLSVVKLLLRFDLSFYMFLGAPAGAPRSFPSVLFVQLPFRLRKLVVPRRSRYGVPQGFGWYLWKTCLYNVCIYIDIVWYLFVWKKLYIYIYIYENKQVMIYIYISLSFYLCINTRDLTYSETLCLWVGDPIFGSIVQSFPV